MPSTFLFHGNIGAGKTFLGTAMVLALLERGEHVAVNWGIVPPEGATEADLRGRKGWYPLQPREEGKTYLYRYDEYEELWGVEDCHIFNDEAQATAGARDWESMGKKTRNWLSHLRHFGNTLVMLSQHYKFVDVYFRRLAPDGVYRIFRLLNLSLAFPNPQADPETGEAGLTSPIGGRLVVRPWHGLDHPSPVSGFFRILKWGFRTPEHYLTRNKDSVKDLTAAPKNAAPPAGARTVQRPLFGGDPKKGPDA